VRVFQQEGALVEEDLFDLREEEVLEPKTYWDLIVGPRAPFLAYCGGGFIDRSFIGSLARVLEEEGALQKEDPSI
jgi:hypothetical protein